MQIKSDKPFIIAYYLPQYHPIPENDEWWGKGFTEWTNVAKAKPLFKGHYQPKIPADLGFYDLRVPEVREQQAELAKEAGINGFCYWHYWFGNGKELLERPFNEVLASGKPNFPFCLGWANESWEAKVWNIKGNTTKKILIEQTYPGKDDIVNHFYSLIKAFKDDRYIRVDGKPLFLIYKPELHPNISEFMSIWNDLAKKEKIADSFFFVGSCFDERVSQTKSLGFNAITIHLGKRMEYIYRKKNILLGGLKYIWKHIFKQSVLISYKDCTKYLWDEKIDSDEECIPTLLSNWDHSPRSKNLYSILTNCTPDLFEKHCVEFLEKTKTKKNKIIFLKSWNEWGEGNYMEPDLKYGKGFINALKQALNRVYPNANNG